MDSEYKSSRLKLVYTEISMMFGNSTRELYTGVCKILSLL
jgi:hypothetical protein